MEPPLGQPRELRVERQAGEVVRPEGQDDRAPRVHVVGQRPEPRPDVVLVAGLLGRAYQRRIDAEEQLLSRDLPGYAAYQQRTKKLIPYLW